MERTLVTAVATDGAAACAALTDGERDACSRLSGVHRQGDFRAGRLAAKRAAAGVLGLAPGRAIEVVSVANGAPRLALVDSSGRRRSADAEISLSHRDGRAVAVAAPAGLRVGVDLERVGSVTRTMTQYFLTEAEEALGLICDPTALWSLKEAAWKALGLGRSLPFKELELVFGDDGWVRAVSVRGVSMPISASLASPWPRYVAATVCTTGVEA